MNIITYFAHAGHDHEAVNSSNSTLILFGGIAGLVIIAAIVLVVLNRRKASVSHPTDEPDKS